MAVPTGIEQLPVGSEQQRHFGAPSKGPAFCPQPEQAAGKPYHPAMVEDPLTPAGQPAATRVLRQFRQVFNAVKSHFQQVEKQAGIGGAQVWALSLIAAQPDIGVGALAQAMDVHQTTASNLVKALAQGGLVVAERRGADRRAVQLQVTEQGRALLERAPGPFSGVLPEALAQMDAPALARLEHDLDQLLALLQPDRHSAKIPLADM